MQLHPLRHLKSQLLVFTVLPNNLRDFHSPSLGSRLQVHKTPFSLERHVLISALLLTIQAFSATDATYKTECIHKLNMQIRNLSTKLSDKNGV